MGNILNLKRSTSAGMFDDISYSDTGIMKYYSNNLVSDEDVFNVMNFAVDFLNNNTQTTRKDLPSVEIIEEKGSGDVKQLNFN